MIAHAASRSGLLACQEAQKEIHWVETCPGNWLGDTEGRQGMQELDHTDCHPRFRSSHGTIHFNVSLQIRIIAWSPGRRSRDHGNGICLQGAEARLYIRILHIPRDAQNLVNNLTALPVRGSTRRTLNRTCPKSPVSEHSEDPGIALDSVQLASTP